MQRSGSWEDPLFVDSRAHEASSPRGDPDAEPPGRMCSEQLPDRHAAGQANGEVQKQRPDGKAPQQKGMERQGSVEPHTHGSDAPGGPPGESSGSASGRKDSSQRAALRNGDAAGPASPSTPGRSANNGQQGNQWGEQQGDQGEVSAANGKTAERTSQRGYRGETDDVADDQGQAAGAKGEDLGPSKEVAFEVGVQWEGSQDVSIAITLLPRRLGLATLLVQVMSALLKLKVRASCRTVLSGRS